MDRQVRAMYKFERSGAHMILTSRLTLLSIALALTTACHRGVSSGEFRVDVSGDLTKASIESRGAPLANILRELRTKYGIDVRLNQDVNPPVTVSVDNVSFEDAVARMVPAGTRYIVRTGAREWASGGPKTGSKAGTAVTPEPGTVQKGAPHPPVAGAIVKRAPDSVLPPPA